MSLSKYFSDERYVTYTYEFTPSYKIPAGSLITISLPNRAGVLTYPNFGNANPKEICTLSDSTLLKNCVMSNVSSTIKVTASVDIPE